MRILKILAATTLAACMALPVMAQETTLKLHHFLSGKAPAHTQMLEPWAKKVETLSGGKVKIELYPSMTLGGRPPELVQQARDGVVDIVWTLNGYTPGTFPRSEVFELPTVYVNDPTATNLAMREMFESDLKQEYGGLEVLFLHVHAGQAIHMVDKEVRTPADLKDTKLRIPTRTGAWVIEALGASPVAMPVPELPQALSKKVVDGALIPWEIIPPLKVYDQTQFQIEGFNQERLGTSVFQVSMNKAKWDSLSDDVKAAFKEASNDEFIKELGALWRGSDNFGIDLAVKNGNTHITLTEEETAAFRDAVAPVVDRWVTEVTASGIDGAGILAKARAAIANNAM